MKLPQIFRCEYNRQYDKPIDCIIVFLLVLIPLLLIAVCLKHYNELLFQFLLFFTGWVVWTFTEYMSHRYLMHSATKEKSIIDFNHAYHHQHPAHIKISRVQRYLLFIGCIIILVISVWMDNYFTLAAGFLFGFPGYAFTHFLLHQKVTQKFLGKLVKYHIYHHCKYPDKCFGISVTWWDDLLGTIPLNPEIISRRIIDFYFMHETEKSDKI